MAKIRCLLIMASLAWSAVGRGDVVSRGDHGFQLRIEVIVAAPPEQVFEALVNRVGAWWDPAHTFGGDASRLSIDARPGGCFCEQLSGGAVQHLVVSYADRGRQLRLLGGLGPLQELGVGGALSFSLTSSEEVTAVVVTYNVSGFFPEGTADWAPAVDCVVTEQVQRLKAHVEASPR